MENEEKKGFDFETFSKEAISGLYNKQALTGDKGIFTPLLKHFLKKH